MSNVATYIPGNWNVICDQCGREYKASDLKQRWDGLMVCQGDWETRQPQDFVHGVADIQTPPFTRPEQSDQFIFVCDMISINGVADYGTADCAAADKDNGYRPVCSLEGSYAIPSQGIPGCMVPNKTQPQLNSFLIG